MTKRSYTPYIFMFLVLFLLSIVIRGCQFISEKVSEHNTIRSFNQDELDSLLFGKDDVIEQLRKNHVLDAVKEEKVSEGFYSYRLSDWTSLDIFTYKEGEYDGLYKDKVQMIFLSSGSYNSKYFASEEGVNLVYQILKALHQDQPIEEIISRSKEFDKKVSGETCITGIVKLGDSIYKRTCPTVHNNYSSTVWEMQIHNLELVRKGYEVYKIKMNK